MSGQIFIEDHDIAQWLGLPTGAEHLYLVYRENGTGAEYVMRSGPMGIQFFGAKMDIEINVPMAQSEDDRGGDSPQDRDSTALDFPGLTDDQAWSIMVKYARGIDAAGVQYSPLGENSNSFVGALLHAAHGQPARIAARPAPALPTCRASCTGTTSSATSPRPPTAFSAARPETTRASACRWTRSSSFSTATTPCAPAAATTAPRAAPGSTRWTAMPATIASSARAAPTSSAAASATTGSSAGSAPTSSRAVPAPTFSRAVRAATASSAAPGPTSSTSPAATGRDDVIDFQNGSDHLQIRSAEADTFADLTVSQVGADLRVAFDHTAIILHDMALADFDASDVIFLPPDTLMA